MKFENPIFFCGFMASGKTTLLKRLGLNEAFDLDDFLLKENHFESVREFVEKKGWEAFRQEEQRLLELFLRREDFYILALGGGSLTEDLVEKIKLKGTLVWLETPFELCLERLSANQEERPLASLGREELRKLYEARLPLYSQASLAIGPKEAEKVTSLEVLQRLIKN